MRLLLPCLLLAFLAGCYNPSLPSGVQACAEGGRCPQGFFCGPDDRCHLPGEVDASITCTADSCKDTATPLCDPATLTCVACLADTDCPSGKVCQDKSCAPGCTMSHGCPDGGGACNPTTGMCLACRGDTDCPQKNPRCDTNSGLCVPCLPAADNCPSGSFCKPVNGSFQCLQGCKIVADCGGAGDAGVRRAACCDHVCIDLDTNESNCGACGTTCVQKTCCAGTCSDTRNDLANCGMCGRACTGGNADWNCALSHCLVASCKAGFGNCNLKPDDGCEVDFRSDAMHCGGCDTACAAANAVPACNGGACAIGRCNDGFADCNNQFGDGCETSIADDVANCGACGMKCVLDHATAVCSAGKCAVARCEAGFADCDTNPANGCEVNTQTDVNNCKACAVRCAAVANAQIACVASACAIKQCNVGFADCDTQFPSGCEVNTTNDVNNCGGCRRTCPATANVASTACVASACAVASCTAPFGDCDRQYGTGCEVNTSNDPANCGGCNVRCGAGLTCVNRACVPAVYSDSFVSAQAAPAQCTHFTTFLAGLVNNNFTSMTLNGTFDQVGVTCNDPVMIGQMITALKTNNGTFFGSCNGRNWAVCNTNGDALFVGAPMLCSGADCPAPGYILRPCIGGGTNPNWGGVNTATCTNQPSQTMTLTFR